MCLSTPGFPRDLLWFLAFHFRCDELFLPNPGRSSGPLLLELSIVLFYLYKLLALKVLTRRQLILHKAQRPVY